MKLNVHSNKIDELQILSIFRKFEPSLCIGNEKFLFCSPVHYLVYKKFSFPPNWIPQLNVMEPKDLFSLLTDCTFTDKSLPMQETICFLKNHANTKNSFNLNDCCDALVNCIYSKYRQQIKDEMDSINISFFKVSEVLEEKNFQAILISKYYNLLHP